VISGVSCGWAGTSKQGRQASQHGASAALSLARAKRLYRLVSSPSPGRQRTVGNAVPDTDMARTGRWARGWPPLIVHGKPIHRRMPRGLARLDMGSLSRIISLEIARSDAGLDQAAIQRRVQRRHQEPGSVQQVRLGEPPAPLSPAIGRLASGFAMEDVQNAPTGTGQLVICRTACMARWPSTTTTPHTTPSTTPACPARPARPDTKDGAKESQNLAPARGCHQRRAG